MFSHHLTADYPSINCSSSSNFKCLLSNTYVAPTTTSMVVIYLRLGYFVLAQTAEQIVHEHVAAAPRVSFCFGSGPSNQNQQKSTFNCNFYKPHLNRKMMAKHCLKIKSMTDYDAEKQAGTTAIRNIRYMLLRLSFIKLILLK